MPVTVHPTALVSKRADLGDGVEIGPFSIVHDAVRLGSGSVVGGYCELGVATPLAESPELVIGAGALIRSHSVFYAGSTFGDGLVTGHRVTVRENTRAGKNVQIGTLCDIQGHCSIGDHVRMHSHVFVAQKSRIGDFVWLFPHAILTNDPRPPSEGIVGVVIGDFAAIGANALVLPGVRVGRGALVGAKTLVRKDVPDECVCVGVPGRVLGPAAAIRLPDGEPAYPWRRHFHRGYPEELVAQWKREFEGAA